MELVVLGLIAVPLYFMVRFSVTVLSWLTGRRFRAYRQLASRYRGRYENRGMSDPPTVSFNHGSSAVRIGLAPPVPGQTLPPRTRVVIRFGKDGVPFRLELAPVGRPAPPQPPRGTRPVRTGNVDFDRHFIVQANDPEIARVFLNEQVCRTMGLLQRLGTSEGMLVSVNPERVLVQVDRNLAMRFETLNAIVQESLIIHDNLLASVKSVLDQGIEIVDEALIHDVEAGPSVCKVCNCPVEPGPRMVCKKCKAPHHRDCWEFNGSCSIFGCNGKEAELRVVS